MCTKSIALALTGALVLEIGCERDETRPPWEPLDTEAYCSLVTHCSSEHVTGPECRERLRGLLVTPACNDAASASSCEDRETPEECFPWCPVDGAWGCRGDGTIAQCHDHHRYIYDCVDLCARKGNDWTYVCGATYQGKVATDGNEVCWCK